MERFFQPSEQRFAKDRIDVRNDHRFDVVSPTIPLTTLYTITSASGAPR